MAQGRVPLKILETDLKGDCNRLNRRLDLIESSIQTVATAAATAIVPAPVTPNPTVVPVVPTSSDTLVTTHSGVVVGGAAITNAELKGSTFNVKEFGAKGDGITDDTRAINNAIDSRNAFGGGEVYFPGGNYLISTPIHIYTNIRLRGDRFGNVGFKIAPNFAGTTILDPTVNGTQTAIFDAIISDIAFRNFHDQPGLWVVNAPKLTDYVRIQHQRLSIIGLDGFTLTALGNGFIGATRNCLWEDVIFSNLDYSQKAAWSAVVTYTLGAQINYGIPAKPYQLIVATSLNDQPDINPAKWALLENCWNDMAFQVNQGDLNVWRRVKFSGTSRQVHTTSGSSIAAGAGQVVTPVNIQGIAVGSVLGVMNNDGTNFEQVTVSAQAGGTFTATFATNKTVTPIQIFGQNRVPFSTTVAANVPNTAPTTIGGGGSLFLGIGLHTITPASMAGISGGSLLWIQNGDGTNGEQVIAANVMATTFDATLTSSKTATAAFQILLFSVVVTPASMTGITAGSRLWISNPDGSSKELCTVIGVTASTFVVVILNGAKTGPGILVSGPVDDPFIEVRAGAENQFYDLEMEPSGFHLNKPRVWESQQVNLSINGYFNEELKIYSSAAADIGVYLFECPSFQFMGNFRPDPYKFVWFVRSSGVIESMGVPGFLGGRSDHLEQYFAFDTTATAKSSVVLRQAYVEQNLSVRNIAWADEGLLIDRVTNSFEVLGHTDDLAISATNNLSQHNASNLLINPSFEAGSYAYLINDGSATVAFPNSQVGVGRMLHLSGSNAAGGKLVEQQIGVVITADMMNRPLTFSAWVKMTATVANPATSQTRAYPSLLIGNVNIGNATNYVYANQGWCQLVQTFYPRQTGNLFVGVNYNQDGADTNWEIFTDDWSLSVGTVGGLDTARFGSVTLNNRDVLYTLDSNPPSYGSWWAGDNCFDGTGYKNGWRINVPTTTVAANIAIGSATVTPASMTNIAVGTVLMVNNSDQSNRENVVVTALAGGGTQFVATFTSTKTGPGIVVTILYPLTTWIDNLTGAQVTLAAPAGSNSALVWQTQGANPSATEIQYLMQRSTNDQDWTYFINDGTHTFQILKHVYNAAAPQLTIGNSGAQAVQVLFPSVVTASRPLKVDGSFKLISGLIDLSSTADTTGVLQAASFPALTGDITTVAGALATTLKNTGAAGTYRSVTTDAQGRVTAGTNPAYPPTTQTDVTGSRVIGTVYQNTGTTPMFVAASINVTNGTVNAITDSAAAPTTTVAATSNGTGSGFAMQLFFIVLPNNYYKVTGGSSVFKWVEWS